VRFNNRFLSVKFSLCILSFANSVREERDKVVEVLTLYSHKRGVYLLQPLGGREGGQTDKQIDRLFILSVGDIHSIYNICKDNKETREKTQMLK